MPGDVISGRGLRDAGLLEAVDADFGAPRMGWCY